MFPKDHEEVKRSDASKLNRRKNHGQDQRVVWDMVSK